MTTANPLLHLQATCPPPGAGRTFLIRSNPHISTAYQTRPCRNATERCANTSYAHGENTGNTFPFSPTHQAD